MSDEDNQQRARCIRAALVCLSVTAFEIRKHKLLELVRKIQSAFYLLRNQTLYDRLESLGTGIIITTMYFKLVRQQHWKVRFNQASKEEFTPE